MEREMPVDQSQFARRVIQFADYLRRMDARTHDEADGSCFLIFDHESPDAIESKPAASNDTSGVEQQRPRYVQFAFEKAHFVMDLPKDTLEPAEAKEIMRRRKGFFYVSERQPKKYPPREVERYDPFRKVFVYGEEQAAAEDTAFIFFVVWRFSLDARLYVTASAFGEGTPRWEQRVAIQ
jgi:hypothetical protein